jgi:hypothetical protein
MPAPTTTDELLNLILLEGLLTPLQATLLMRGKWRGYQIGKYRLLDRLGSGGTSLVYLCEHTVMRRLVAIKVFSSGNTAESLLLRFYREARVVAALDHPNIVRAHDVDRDGQLHFLVLEYVDGSSLQDVVTQHGRLSLDRAVEYVAQAACGLAHAHAAGIVHRDVKPGNILVNRQGVVKILDMGLARLFRNPQDNLTALHESGYVMGTVDYLAPEQGLDSDVDVRADLYSLGATFYFLLAGQAPFADGTLNQKLIWHQTRVPPPVRSLRPEVPAGLEAVLNRLLAKDPDDRYQSAEEVVEALAPWRPDEVAPPPEWEMPQHCVVVANSLRARAEGNGEPAAPPRRRSGLHAVPAEARREAAAERPREPARLAPARAAVALDREADPEDPSSATTVPLGAEVVTDRITRPGAPSRKRAAAPPRAGERWLVPAAVLVAAVLMAGGGRALWRGLLPGTANAQPLLITPAAAADHVDQRCTVEMVVRSVGYGRTRPVVFLNSEADFQDTRNFTAHITEVGTQRFKEARVSDFKSHFQDKTIRVTGTVVRHNDELQILVNDPSSVEILDRDR